MNQLKNPLRPHKSYQKVRQRATSVDQAAIVPRPRQQQPRQQAADHGDVLVARVGQQVQRGQLRPRVGDVQRGEVQRHLEQDVGERARGLHADLLGGEAVLETWREVSSRLDLGESSFISRDETRCYPIEQSVRKPWNISMRRAMICSENERTIFHVDF